MTRRRRAGYAPKGCFGIPLNIEKKNLQGNKNNSFVTGYLYKMFENAIQIIFLKKLIFFN
jgi:hypothetical protein